MACLTIILLAACTAPKPVPAVGQSTSALSATLEPVASSTQEAETTSAVPTNLPTSTPSPSPTAEPSLTPTVEMIMPELYPVNQCVSKYLTHFTIEFCVVNVWVKPNRHMVFNVTWTATGIPKGAWVTKRSDEFNKNMYVTDNIGNRYDHIAGGGKAYADVGMDNNVTLKGSFEFNPPPPRATYFSFHDDDNDLLITHISLDIAAAPYGELALANAGFQLRYNKEDWHEATAENGESELDSSKISACTIQSLPNRDPRGAYKNTLDIRTIQYAIYGYLDQANGTAYREYYAIGGLSGLSEADPVLFLVTIPLAQSDACLGSVSTALMDLQRVEK